MERSTFTIAPTPPYDFDLTAAYVTYFRGQYGADTFQDGVLTRLLDLDDTLCLASVRSRGTTESPLLEVTLEGPALGSTAMSKAHQQVSSLLGAGQDPVPFYHMAQEDPVLAPLARALWGLHIPQTASVYEALVLAILGQQISAQVARTLRTLMINTYGPALEVAGLTYRAFPRPESLATAGVDGLRAIKLSGRKAEYVADIAARVASGQLDLEGLRTLPDEEVARRLSEIRGVGPWTVQWLLIRALGRPDGFPHTDLALVRSLGLLLNAGSPFSPNAALEYSQRWIPFRSFATSYLFAAARSGILQAPRIHPA